MSEQQQKNGTSQPAEEDPKAAERKAQRAAQVETNKVEQEGAKQGVNLAILSGKVVEFRPKSATEMWLLAQYFFAAKTVLPSRLGSIGDVFMTLMAGDSLDILPIVALRSIIVVEGKIFLEGDLVHSILNARLRREDGEYVELIESTDKGATYEFMRKGWKAPKLGVFNEVDAKAAGLLEKRGPWQQYRKAMYRHRAIITWGREYFPEHLLGVYTNEEQEEFGRDVNARPAEGVIPRTSAPTQVDAAPRPPASAGVLEAPSQKVRIEEPAAKEISVREVILREPAKVQEQPSEGPAAEPSGYDRVLDLVSKAETADVFPVALASIQNLPKEQQVEPRLALCRQIDLYLGEKDATGKPVNPPTADIGKLLSKTVAGLPENQQELGRNVYNRYKFPRGA